MDTLEKPKKPVKKRNFLTAGFGPIDNETDARALAKGGAVAALLLTISETIGAVMTYFGTDPTTFKSTADGALTAGTLDSYVTIAVMAAMILALIFMTWRIYAGRGYVSAALVLALLLFETYAKTMGHTLNGGWAVVYLGLAVSLFGAIRACWWLRRIKPNKKTASVAAVFDAPTE